MNIEIELKTLVQEVVAQLYPEAPTIEKLDQTRPEFKGEFTLVVFPLTKISKKSPEITAHEIGTLCLQRNPALIQSFEIVKGFLNFSLTSAAWLSFTQRHLLQASEWTKSKIGEGKKVMVEYSSPNTNKPLHLGHIRNNLLGFAVSSILSHNGYQVIKANLINDRGIHICKSMVAWLRFGNGETPESSGLKGDHLVGKYYVIFDQHYSQQKKQLIATGLDEKSAEKQAPLILEAQEMLRKWEAGDAETLRVWEMMNQWVYKGFEVTYNRLGVDFNQYYYESNTYLLGKELIEEGLGKGVFYKKDDGSVWIDLKAEGLDEKLLLRSDGTSVYITQDMGTADKKFADYQADYSVYVVGNEQDYHFKVLFLIMQKLGRAYAGGLFHLSYGMVDLPEGKMKSREGTVVDADDLMEEMRQTAESITKELGKTEGLSEKELSQLFEDIGMGALKYFLLKVDPSKRILFNPKETIDFQGNTGLFLQYTFARISSLLRLNIEQAQLDVNQTIETQELHLIRVLQQAKQQTELAARLYSPAVICNYLYELVKAYNRMYHDLSILKEASKPKRHLRLILSEATKDVLETGFNMIGMPLVSRM